MAGGQTKAAGMSLEGGMRGAEGTTVLGESKAKLGGEGVRTAISRGASQWREVEGGRLAVCMEVGMSGGAIRRVAGRGAAMAGPKVAMVVAGAGSRGQGTRRTGSSRARGATGVEAAAAGGGRTTGGTADLMSAMAAGAAQGDGAGGWLQAGEGLLGMFREGRTRGRLVMHNGGRAALCSRHARAVVNNRGTYHLSHFISSCTTACSSVLFLLSAAVQNCL